MKRVLILACSALLFSNCVEKKKNESIGKKEEKIETSSPILETGCYTYEGNGNKISFEITNISETILGNLDYALKEKDANTGTFAGTLKDNVLIGRYTFTSEGMESTREVAFMVKDDQLIEGYGELDGTGTAFEDKNALSFSSSMPLSKSECDSEF